MLSTPMLASIQYTYIAKGQLLNKVPSVDGSTTNAANGNLTRRTTLVSGAPTGAYVQSSCDQRDQLARVEFYKAQVKGTATLAKTVANVYVDSSMPRKRALTIHSHACVAKNLTESRQVAAFRLGTVNFCRSISCGPVCSKSANLR